MMKRKISNMLGSVFLAALLIGAGAFTATGQEIGGNINSRSSVSDGDPSFRNSLSVFIRRNPETASDAPTYRWVAEGGLTARTTFDDRNRPETETTPDLNILRVEAIYPGVLGDARSALRLTGGRIPYSEPTRIIFSDRIDGLRAGFEFSRFGITAVTGYTGLIPGANSGVVMSGDDIVAREDSSEFFGARRVLAGLSVAAPELIGTQQLTAGGLAQFDARGDYDNERLNSQYGYLKLDGGLFGSVYSETSVGASFVQRSAVDQAGDLLDPEATIGFAGRLQTRAYLGANDDSVITSTGHYASGSSEDVGAFTPMTGPPVDLLGPVRQSDLALFKLDYAYRPFAGDPGARARSLEIGTYGAVEFPADFDADGGFRGIESGARVAWRPLSDFGGRLWAGAYIPGDDDPQFLGRIDLSTSF